MERRKGDQYSKIAGLLSQENVGRISNNKVGKTLVWRHNKFKRSEICAMFKRMREESSKAFSHGLGDGLYSHGIVKCTNSPKQTRTWGQEL